MEGIPLDMLSCDKPQNVDVATAYLSAPLKVVQTLESFSKEYKWVNIGKCKRPAVKPPSRIWLDGPPDLRLKDKKMSFRRWADGDGDGICEVYDVEVPDDGPQPERYGGYRMRTSVFDQGKWHVAE